MQQIEYTQASYTFSYTFTTQTPPFGGNITLQPSPAGTYTLTFKDWQGVNPPLAYRVSSTSGDNLKLADLSNGWQAFNQTYNNNFTFTPINFFPLLVELTDYSEEIHSQYVAFENATALQKALT